MVVFDASGNVLTEYSDTGGTFEAVNADVIHAYVIDTEEKGHYETVAEYPNGGKDVEWVVDEPETGHWETRFSDSGEIAEHCDIQIPDDFPRDIETPDVWTYYVYTPYTPEEIAEMARVSEIEELKAKLTETDYVVTKLAEATASGDDLPEDDAKRYAEIIKQRKEWRARINELEAAAS